METEFDEKYLELRQKYNEELDIRFQNHLNQPNEYGISKEKTLYNFFDIIVAEKNKLTCFYIAEDNCKEIFLMIRTLKYFEKAQYTYSMNPVKAFFEFYWNDLKNEAINRVKPNFNNLKPWEQEEIDFANSNIEEVVDFLATYDAYIETREKIYSMIYPSPIKEIIEMFTFRNWFIKPKMADKLLVELKKMVSTKLRKKRTGPLAFLLIYTLWENNLLTIDLKLDDHLKTNFEKTNVTNDFNNYMFGDEKLHYYDQNTLFHNSKFTSITKNMEVQKFKDLHNEVVKLIKQASQ